MWILWLAEDSLETSSLIFPEKQWKNIFMMQSAAVVTGPLRVNKWFEKNIYVLNNINLYVFKKVGSWSFEGTILLQIYFIICRKALFIKK